MRDDLVILTLIRCACTAIECAHTVQVIGYALPSTRMVQCGTGRRRLFVEGRRVGKKRSWVILFGARRHTFGQPPVAR
jgi:hypothetical protein